MKGEIFCASPEKSSFRPPWTSLLGGPPTLSDKGGRGVQNPKKRPDITYGCPESNISSSIYLLLLYLESRIFSKKSYNTVSYTPVELRKIFANILSVVWLHFLFGGGFAAPNFQSLVQFDVKLDLHRRIYLFTYYSRKLKNYNHRAKKYFRLLQQY